MKSLARWLKFNAVGIAGAVIQIWFLHLFLNAHANYLASTGLAVEAAVLHNFAWHQRYTWADRPCNDLVCVLGRLGRFHLSNGAVSIVGNVVLMRVLVGGAGLSPLAANGAAILACSLVNYYLGDRFVFSGRGDHSEETQEPGFHAS